MFDIGFWEIFLIGIVGLLVIGPDRLPGVARSIGCWVGKAQRMVDSVKSDISRELESGELRELLGEQKKQIEALQGLVSNTKNEMETSTREAIEAGEKSWAGEAAELHTRETGEQANTPNSIMPPAAAQNTQDETPPTAANNATQHDTEKADDAPDNAENRTTA